ncbi:MAG: DUF523 domain-containing protein [Candidatus Riflebacteria bacterium]|nr:DUF523 domain-containing protein [Candidatus Riflebacteria bacterium]MBF0500508.1 DUF523 domain-containing protein [Candidatus Riflebacteria bacterium]
MNPSTYSISSSAVPLRILVSTCLFGLSCPYHGNPGAVWQNGFDTLTAAVLENEQFVFIPVCPEQLGGLPTPRPPVELQAPADAIFAGQGSILSERGDDLTSAFILGARQTLLLAERLGARMAIFKEKSPSCGRGRIYSGAFDGRLISGDGMTTALLRKSGILVHESETVLQLWRNYHSLDIFKNLI